MNSNCAGGRRGSGGNLCRFIPIHPPYRNKWQTLPQPPPLPPGRARAYAFDHEQQSLTSKVAAISAKARTRFGAAIVQSPRTTPRVALAIQAICAPWPHGAPSLLAGGGFFIAVEASA